MAEFRRAQQLDPLSVSVSNGIGRVFHFERRYDEALAQFKRTLELDPEYAEAYFNIGMTYLAMKRYDDATAAMQRALKLSNNRPVIAAMLAMTKGLAGDRAAARSAYDETVRTAQSPYFLALVSIGLGDTDQTFRYLDEALAQRDGIMIYLGVEPSTMILAEDPRYAAILRKMGLN
jgi:Flp pilus assembly protein TadD